MFSKSQKNADPENPETKEKSGFMCTQPVMVMSNFDGFHHQTAVPPSIASVCGMETTSISSPKLTQKPVDNPRTLH